MKILKFTIYMLVFCISLLILSCGENSERTRVINYYKQLYEQLARDPNAIPDNTAAQKSGFKDDIEAVAAALKYMNDSEVDTWAKKYAALNDSIVKVKANEAEKMMNDINSQSGNEQIIKEMNEAEKKINEAEKAMDTHRKH